MDGKTKTLVRYIVGVASVFPRVAVLTVIVDKTVVTLWALGRPEHVLQDIIRHIAKHKINAGVWPGGDSRTEDQIDTFDDVVMAELMRTNTSPEDGLKMFVAMLTLLYISGIPLAVMKNALEELWADERLYYIDPKTLNGWMQ